MNRIRFRIKQSIFNSFRENETQLHELNYLFWECTHRCNLKCLHCGSDCVQNSVNQDMPFEDFLKAILPVRKAYKNPIIVVLTGGEPLLRNDIDQCGKTLREHGFHWGLVTNGFRYDDEIHNKLLSSGMSALTLSIDGFEENHNWLRGNPKSFEKAIQTLDIIRMTNGFNYDVVTCVNARNINELPALKEFFISKRVKAWRLFTISPIGRAAGNEQMLLNPRQHKYLMDFIAQTRIEDKNKIDIKFSCEAYVGNYECKVRDSFFFCRAGINIGSVLIDGSISACPNIDRSFVQGNIYKDDFLDVWENRFQIMRDKQWTKTGICDGCKDYSHCKGGALHLWNQEKKQIRKCIQQDLEETY